MQDLDTPEAEALPATVDEVRGWVADAPAADVEATVGWWLRRLGELEREIAALEAREEAELGRVRAHYARQRAPLNHRAGEVRRAIEAVARAWTWGRRKSMQLAYGTFGVRAKPAAVRVVDQGAAVAWARAHAPAAVVVQERVDHRAVAPVVLQLVREAGEVPDGFDYTEADVQPYATPSSLVAALGADEEGDA